MWPYFLFLAVAGIPALYYTARNNSGGGWVIAWILFVLFIGLRHRVGGDWGGYLLITDYIHNASFYDAMRRNEYLFSFVTYLSTRVGAGVYGANFVGAIIFTTGLFAYCRTQANPWLALAAATPFLVIVAVMSANRQGIAIGVSLFVMSRWQRTGFFARSAGIAVAALFHTSAAFLILLTFSDLKISKIRKILMMVIAGVLTLWLVSRSEVVWTRYTQTYIGDQPEGVYSPGAIFHLLLNLVPALIMLTFRRVWSRLLPNWELIQRLCFITIVLFALVPFFTVAVGRISLYLFPISISFISSLPLLVRDAAGRTFLRALLLVILGVVLWLWLSFANTAFTYLPYQNVLFLDPGQLELP
jgi:hypothetical protein